jgi:Tol biopolymer transport system component
MAAVAVAVGLWNSNGGAPESRQIRFTVPAPQGTVFHLEGLAPGPVALSPDGRRIAFTVRGVGGVIHLAMRDLDSVETRYLEEAEGAQYPFWSPDGTEIGFFTRSGAALRVIPADGGPVRTLCASRNGKGGSWNRDGVIVFTADSNTPISAVSAGGGEPWELTAIDREAGENSHRHPQFLPDGKRFLYLARNVGGPDAHTVKVGSLNPDADVEILRAPVAAAFVDGKLLYLRDRKLIARLFDTDSLEFSGEELEVIDDVMVIEGAARGVFSATEEVLVFQQGEEHTLGELVWLDRSGATVGRVGDVASYFSVAVSPDGSKVAAPVSNMIIGTNDLWISDVERDLRSRVTFDDGEDLSPVWSSDGRQVYFVSNRSGKLEVYRLTPGTTGEPELIVGGDRSMTPTSESPDGGRLLLTMESKTAGSDLVILDLERGGDPQPFRATRFNEDHATFSPDGRWVAYASDESGRFEIYLTPATADGRHWQVSTEGGLWPRWIAATGEILYQDTSGRFVVVSVRTGDDAIEIGDPEVLFGGYAATRLYQLFDPAPDGSRLLYRALSNEDPPEPPIVVVNWQVQGGPS